MIEQSDALEPYQPLLDRMPEWWLGAEDDCNQKFTEDEKAIQGPGPLAWYKQRQALHRMRTDPAVVGSFRPEEFDGMEFVLFDGQPYAIGVLFKKLELWHGVLRSSSSSTQQQIDRRNGPLLIGDVQIHFLVLGYLSEGPSFLSAAMSEILIGQEGASSFDWKRSLWRRGGDGSLFVSTPQQPLFGPTRIVPRAPMVAPGKTVVGQRVEEKREISRKQKEGDQRKKGGA